MAATKNCENIFLIDCKTEFLVLMSPHQLRKYGLPDLQLGTVLIKPAVSARNLGSHFDQMLTMVWLQKMWTVFSGSRTVQQGS